MANDEYTDEVLMFRGYDPENPTREQVEIAWAAHGLSVVAVEEERRSGRLTPVPRHRLNRRVTATTEFRLTGPAAGSDLVKTSADRTGRKVLGTLNNCSGGTTPWGTTLHGEENFNQYFANASSATDKRYGIGTGATERKWERFDKRFDVAQEPNEVHRFGYVVELDPYDPDSTPRKHTLLGRFKHEAATVRLTSDGRPVVYTGDDERFDYSMVTAVCRTGMRRAKGTWSSASRSFTRSVDGGQVDGDRVSGRAVVCAGRAARRRGRCAWPRPSPRGRPRCG
ncbi:PhoX family protein OS=Streptomyces tendae OX=1932 GN=GUR47_20560 PE=4 SV=1 [Streptomyces tendae]